MSPSDPLPAPFRPAPIRAMNALGRAAARVGWPVLPLSPEALLARARRQQRLDDFGPESFREPFERLVESLERDARLNAFGRYFARRQLLELLGHRLVLTEHRRRHPEVAQQRVERPLFVVGLPRTGTTLLYGLLACDPAHRAPLSWEVDQPCPPARAATRESDPRIETTRRRFEQLQQLAPGFQAIHPIGERMPQECIVLTASAFLSIRFEMCFDVTRYQDWMMTADMAPAYAWHRRFLQHMQSGLARERWVLKSPGHLGPIEALLGEYPDAMIVQTHRDPLEIMPSMVSLEYTMRWVSTDHQDVRRLAEQQLRMWSQQLHMGIEARDRLTAQRDRFVDLHFRDLLADPLGCVARVYDHFGLELGAEAERRMHRYLDENPRDRHGRHAYSLDMYRLGEDEVRSAFKGYTERYGIEPGPRREG